MHQIEGPGDAHRHGRHHRKIDAAPYDRLSHADAEDPQNGDVLDQRENVAGAEETRRQDREADKQQRRDRQDNAFLAEMKISQRR